MEKVTYTKDQLLAFTKKELSTIGLSSGVNMKLNKSEIVKQMMSAQKAEKNASLEKAKSEIKKEPTSSKSKSNVKDKVKTSTEQVKGSENAKDEVAKSVKPHFHRRRDKARNRMTFR